MKKLLFVGALVLLISSCTDEDKFRVKTDEVISNQGAFIRLEGINSGEIDLNNITTSEVSFLLEEWDVEDGALLDNITLTVDFLDRTPANGTATGSADLGTVPASAWTADEETGLPRYTVEFTANDLLARTGLTPADLDGGDIFRFEWTLNLTNGKSFDRTKQSSSLPAWDFYNSPFLLDVGVVCLLPDGFATGSYAMTQTVGPADPFFGEPTTFYEGDVELIVGATSTERLFDFTWISFGSTMGMNLVCGRTEVSAGADPGASCGTPIVWLTNGDSGNGTFDPMDDSVITLRFVDDFENTCGIQAIIELTLTKN